MLQVQNIKKKYIIGDYEQVALNDVSLNLRDSEFIAILGQSGSGKTTLLNIIGGLDRYDDGDLIINNISTKKYKDKDWDSYRNHTVGFIFQSYNLIGHQSILTNVELALTISGISKSTRRQKAKEALKEVGLEKHIHKKPNQLSGGQMQRVAIARALINNPDILLADEPTGALDSETSVQIMELLKEVAKDRLVVMVTHNPELATEYATRIVNLRDGKIIDDSDPFTPKSEDEIVEHKNMGKSSMSFATALSLSFNNLKTKKRRTILTAFAGSIGIIGISLILALSSGVNIYISDIQKETMSSYPITIESQTINFDPSMGGDNKPNRDKTDSDEVQEILTGIYANYNELQKQEKLNSTIIENNLTNFKLYLDDPTSEIHQYIGSDGIVYSYDLLFDVYVKDSDDNIINTDYQLEESGSLIPVINPFEMMSGMSSGSSANFSEIISNSQSNEIGSIVNDNYDVLYGEWANEYNEVVLVLGDDNDIDVYTLFQLGFITLDEYKDIEKSISEGKTVEKLNFSYQDVIDHSFMLVPHCDYYEETENGTFAYTTKEPVELVENAIELTVVGVVKAKEDAVNTSLNTAVAYTNALTNYIIDYTSNSSSVTAQEKDEDINIFTGIPFESLSDQAKVENTVSYLLNLSTQEKAQLYPMLMSGQNTGGDKENSMIATTQEDMALAIDFWLTNDPEDAILLTLYDSYIQESTYLDNLALLGKVNYNSPSSIKIYTDSFEDKDFISIAIENYNETVEDEQTITYVDYVAILTSSLTTIIDVISYVLIGFVSVSLVVSCIMIGVITHISVMERTKEIGILRALGASKLNISQVFNAETLIIGLCSGLLGVGLSSLLIIPINSVIHMVTGNEGVNAVLPITSAIILVIISVVITVVSGVVPAKNASKKDPVIALRTE